MTDIEASEEGNAMQGFALIVLAAVTLTAAVYAHWQLPAFTPSSQQLWINRLLLAVIGAGFGWAVATRYYPVGGWLQTVVFLASFGLVHVPAAAVLAIKRRQSN